MNTKTLSKFRFQFITNETTRFSHIQAAQQALLGGCKWIQLRVKLNNPASSIKTIDALAETAYELKKICNEYKAKLIINDYVEICQEIKAFGVHLGKNDIPVGAARKILGDKYIIGGTANTFEDISNLLDSGADYIGLGPLRFTETKENLSPILGFSGLEDILSRLTKEMKKVHIVAIGGIITNDILHLLHSGVTGVAVSGDILRSENPKEKSEEILEIIENFVERHYDL